MDHINIEVPQLHHSDLVACYAQLRPYRQGGIRVEKQMINSKTIIHNYGHGGAGVSLAPASANEALNLAKNEVTLQNANIAIIGSGIVGILMARQIISVNSSARITIYAEQIPVFGNKKNSQMITSEVAPGFWLPYHYGCSDQDLHERYSDFSYAYYKKMSVMKQYSQFLKEVNVYELTDGPDRDETVVHLTSDMAPTLKQIDITLNNKTIIRARVFKSLKVDMQPFLHILMKELKGKVNFVHKKITKQNLENLNQKIIFNCSGLGSRELFGDNKMKGKKGHLLQYKNTNPTKYDYFLRANFGNRKMLYYMHQSRIIIGRTVETEQNKVINQQVVKDIMEIHKLIRQKFNLNTISPKL